MCISGFLVYNWFWLGIWGMLPPYNCTYHRVLPRPFYDSIMYAWLFQPVMYTRYDHGVVLPAIYNQQYKQVLKEL